MNLIPVLEHLERQGIGAVGQDLFVYSYPASIETGIMLRPSLTGVKLDYYLPGYLKFRFQMVARANNYGSAEELIKAAMKAVTLSNDESSVQGWCINYMRPEHIPVGYPVSIGQQVEFNLWIEVCAVVPEWA